ncbi:MAG: tetratricopeptide repeat protein [Myxococcota bacterium]
MRSPSRTFGARGFGLRFSRPLLAACAVAGLGTPALAGVDELVDGAGAVEIAGIVEVPMLRGVDTDGVPSVLAQGAEKDEPDEFLLVIDIFNGANQCTEPVAKALGGAIDEQTFARQSEGLGSATKTVGKVAIIPELRLMGGESDVVIRNWRCVIDKSENRLAIPLLAELSVAQLNSTGVFVFGRASDADQVLGKVGTPVNVAATLPNVSTVQGKKFANTTATLYVPAKVAGTETFARISATPGSAVSMKAGDLPNVTEVGSTLHTTAQVQVLDVVTPMAGLTVWDSHISTAFGATNNDNSYIDALLGSDMTAHMDMAVDPSTLRIAIKGITESKWTDPSDKMLEDAKKQFDKKDDDDKAALLQPMEFNVDTSVAMAELPCFEGSEVIATPNATANGIRYFGSAGMRGDPKTCPPVDSLTAEEGGSDDAGGGSDSGDKDTKEASRYANWGDALLKHGKYAEALDAYTTANKSAGPDCSYYMEHAALAQQLGKLDMAMESATKAADLYDAWASQPLEVRLAVKAGGDVPDGTETESQSDTCHTAHGLQASILLAKGSHKKVEALYKEHMDLDETLALATALSRLQRGQPGRARGLVLQALNVGGRKSADVWVANGVTGSRMGASRIVDATLDSMGAKGGALTLGNALAGAAMAREVGGDDRVGQYTDALVKRMPDSVAAWTVHGLEGLRRGDAKAQSDLQANAEKAAQFNVDASAGSADALCGSAAMLYVAGDNAAADAFMTRAGESATVTETCLSAAAVKTAVSGDAQGTTNALNELAVRYPFSALGSLNLLPAVPPSSADAGGPE